MKRRWGVHNNMVMLPKTVNPKRMTENADLERFNILVEDMIALDALDEHLVTDWQVYSLFLLRLG